MFRSLIAVSLALSASTAVAREPGPAAEGAGGAKPKQLLLVSFDGAHDNRLWARSRNIAKRADAHFTYFLSCATLIPRARAADYKAPGIKAGRSNIGFASDVEEVSVRLDHIWKARSEGNEIASHTCGHFDGKDWTKAQWLNEFETFDQVLLNAWKDNGLADREPKDWADFVKNDITGFRAPYLSAPDSLFQAEREHGFRYDASVVTHDPALPVKKTGLARFGLPLIPEGPRERRIIAMDYNLFIRHSAGIDHPSKGDEFAERSYKAFRQAFETQYNGDRIPLQIGVHFVTMNGGAYWAAMERLVAEVCPRPDVACVTYSEALDMLESRDGSTATPGAM
ncbi:polysaccharide deacetylase family protein [Rhizobium rhizophilum]|uniref:Polysaccharide deacetylase n=1 Tax=Rhizobium rhizophilum TaxID=1850373 RepID=A0ABY2QWX2_9HYPH|nr:polysaccharide deacetylase family protein [Rhizobium rhizophilum]THV15546.1 polysaccharide deacetylase [Rhizobium rhizophilum]